MCAGWTNLTVALMNNEEAEPVRPQARTAFCELAGTPGPIRDASHGDQSHDGNSSKESVSSSFQPQKQSVFFLQLADARDSKRDVWSSNQTSLMQQRLTRQFTCTLTYTCLD